MPAAKKVGTQLLVSPETRATGQALALIRNESVAEVTRPALEAALERMARRYEGQMLSLDASLAAIGGNRIELLDVISKSKPPIRLVELDDPATQARIRIELSRRTT